MFEITTQRDNTYIINCFLFMKLPCATFNTACPNDYKEHGNILCTSTFMVIHVSSSYKYSSQEVIDNRYNLIYQRLLIAQL